MTSSPSGDAKTTTESIETSSTPSLSKGRMILALYDTETTDNKPLKADAISIGSVLCKNERGVLTPIATFHTLIYTDVKSTAAAYKVHGIHPSQLEGQPRFPEACELFANFLHQHTDPSDRVYLVAHNSRFDESILYSNSVRYGFDFQKLIQRGRVSGFLDTLKCFRGEFKTAPEECLPRNPAGRPSFALGNMHKSFLNEDIKDAHDALADCHALCRVINSKPCAKITTVRNMLIKYLQPVDKTISELQKKLGYEYWVRQQNEIQHQHHIRVAKKLMPFVYQEQGQKRKREVENRDSQYPSEEHQKKKVFKTSETLEHQFRNLSPDKSVFMCIRCMTMTVQKQSHECVSA